MRSNYQIEFAEDNRDAMAKAIYGRLFAWIVKRANDLLAPRGANYKEALNREGGVTEVRISNGNNNNNKRNNDNNNNNRKRDSKGGGGEGGGDEKRLLCVLFMSLFLCHFFSRSVCNEGRDPGHFRV